MTAIQNTAWSTAEAPSPAAAPSGAGWGALAFAGLILATAIGLVVATLSINRKKAASH